MIVYKFYLHNPQKGDELIGVLPERRKNPARITLESVMNWGRKLFGNTVGMDNIFFLQVRIDTNGGK